MTSFLEAATEDEEAFIPGNEPMGWLIVAIVADLISGGLLIAGASVLDAVPRHLAGWLLASVVGTSGVVLQRRAADQARLRQSHFRVHDWIEPLRMALLAISTLLIVAHAWNLATELAS